MPIRHLNIVKAAINKAALLCLGVTILCALSVLAAAETRLTVSVTGGRVRGAMHQNVAAFKGIPFAQPPTGALRWKSPLPSKPWRGIRDGSKSAAPCAQVPAGWNDAFAAAGQEDCLYLDVWTGEWPPKSRKPVMVWLHGGANSGGAGGFDPLYDGAALVQHGVVLVLVQYRLGIFGFFAHPELTRESPYHSSGNYAIWDQIAALLWVRDNIASFGGDPANVTLFGQSAGAVDALLLMTSPLSKGLFHRVIGESGALSAFQPMPGLAEIEEKGRHTAQQLNAPAENALPYLRSLPASDLLKLKDRSASISADGWVFAMSPSAVFASSMEHPVPLIIGSNAIELPAEGPPDQLRKRLESDFGTSSKALQLYGLGETDRQDVTDPLYGDLNDQMGSDGFRCAVVQQGEWHSAASNAVWEYQFDRAIPPKSKTTHSGELAYVFGNLYSEGSQGGSFQEADRKLSATMQTYWTNFAKTGDPNGSGVSAWPRFNSASRQYLEFTADGGTSVRSNQRGPYCDLYRERMKNAGGRPAQH